MDLCNLAGIGKSVGHLDDSCLDVGVGGCVGGSSEGLDDSADFVACKRLRAVQGYECAVTGARCRVRIAGAYPVDRSENSAVHRCGGLPDATESAVAEGVAAVHVASHLVVGPRLLHRLGWSMFT